MCKPFLTTLIAAALLGYASQGQGQAPKSVPAEALLSADTVLFVRHDGYESHRQAYDKTTLARLMKDDLGEFLEYLGTYSRDLAIRNLLQQGEGKPAVDKEKAISDTRKFVDYFKRNGVAVGFGIRDGRQLRMVVHPGQPAPPPPPVPPGGGGGAGGAGGEGSSYDIVGGQTTIIFPQGGLPANRPVVFSFLKLLAGMAGQETVEKKLGSRAIYTAENDAWFTWWQERDHVILLTGAGAIPLKGAIDVIEGRKPNLTATPLFKNLTEFKNYETIVRGLVNVEKIADLVRVPDEQNGQLDMIKDALLRRLALHQLGVDGVKGLTFHMGYSGKYQRRTVILHVPERNERTGLLKALTYSATDPKTFGIDNLPPLPPDAAGVHVLHVDWHGLYDYADQLTKLATLSDRLGGLQTPIVGFDLNRMLKLDFRKDVLDTLDSTVVIYRAQSEGFLYMGQSLAIKLKDAKKLRASADIMNHALTDADVGVRFQKRVYRGIDMRVLTGASAAEESLLVLTAPTYAIHKDWLVLGVFPQSVKGNILRSEGDRKVWQAPSYYKELLVQSQKEGGPGSRLAGISVIDPVPDINLGLGLLPMLGQYLNLTPLSPRFDVSKLPNAQAITEFVYPTVRFYFDDGTALRWETHFAINFPQVDVFLLYSIFGAVNSL